MKSQTGSTFTSTTADWPSYSFSVHGYYNWRNVAIREVVCQSGDAIIEVGYDWGLLASEPETGRTNDEEHREASTEAAQPATPPALRTPRR